MNSPKTFQSGWSPDDCGQALAALEAADRLDVLVVGDLMVDAYLLGRVERISPEAPVPILRADQRERRPGGAANVALNLRALGASVTVAGVVGHDADGLDLQEALRELDLDAAGVLCLPGRRTTVKTRVMSGGQHLIRVDEEDDTDLDAQDGQLFLETLATTLSHRDFDAILIEDYDKGVLSPAVIEGLLHMARERNIPVSVDPKFRHFELYRGVALFKPNLKEMREGLGLVWDDQDPDGMERALDAGLDRLLSEWRPEAILLTLSEKGVRMRTATEDVRQPAHPREILDVSGAGDTVIAVATVLMAAGVEPAVLAQVSNLAGGLVCEKPGVVPVDPEALMEEIRRLPIQA